MFLRLKVSILYASLKILSFVPSGILSLLVGALARLGTLFAKKERAKLETNILHIYGLPAHSEFAKSFTKQVFTHQIFVALESFLCGVSEKHMNNLRVVGFAKLKETMQALKNQGKGVIIITGHLGNWELVAKYAADAANEPFYALAKASSSKAVTQFIERTREVMSTKVLWSHKKSILRDMIGVLKRGSCLGFVMDQKPEGRTGPKVDFLGHEAAFVSGPAKLSIKTKAPVLAIFCMREGWLQYRLICKEVLPPGHMAEDEVKITQTMADEIGNIIKLYPEQWVWNYKRWRFN